MSDDLKEIIMPSMGEGITEATLIKWLKKPGEKVAKDEPLLEVSTDKVDTEIPSPHDGFLIKTYASEGENVDVNGTIAFVSDNADATAPDKVESAKPPAAAQAPMNSPSPSSSAVAQPQIVQTGEVRSSPLVRKIAREMNINLGAVAGRGAAGRITKADILNFISQTGIAARDGAAPPHEELARQETVSVAGQEMLDGVPVRREPMSKMRRLTAEHMVRSVATSPHVTTVFEMDMHKIVSIRSEHLDAFTKKHGFKITYTHFISYCAVQAIKQHMIVNTSVDGFDVLYKDDINLGMAVAIDSGLIVPVIRYSQEMNLTEFAAATNDIVARARSKKLNPEDVRGGTFSITNPGLFGSVVSAPIINQPQVAILSIGTIVKRAVVVDDDITIRPLCQIGLTFDHRIIDGEGGARYLATLKEIIETFSEIPD